MNKGLEALKHLNKNIIVAEDIDEDFNIIEKELKVLEFVRKTLHVEPREYHLSDGKSEYVLKYDVYSRSITKEEFDLLNELGDF